MKRKIKKQYLPIMGTLLVLVALLAMVSLYNNNLQVTQDPSYTNDEIVEKTLPVINTTKKIIDPFTDPSVKLGKTYYDYKATSENQINSIIKHDDTYIQNTGNDYVSTSVFDVNAILDGTVINVKEDEMIGKVVEIKHENDMVSIYQSLSETNVKKGDIVSQGQILGKSGTNEIDKDLGNHLHLEIYLNGQVVNPENYLNKEVETKKNN